MILPKASTSFNGFTPGDKMKNIGVVGLVSSKDLLNSNVRFSTYFAPIFSSMYALKVIQVHLLLSKLFMNCCYAGVGFFILTLLHTSFCLVLVLLTYTFSEGLFCFSIPVNSVIINIDQNVNNPVPYNFVVQQLSISTIHTCGNFSRSGHSTSTIFFHLLGEVSISLSKFLNSSLPAKEQMPPQLWLERKSTGLVT